MLQSLREITFNMTISARAKCSVFLNLSMDYNNQINKIKVIYN